MRNDSERLLDIQGAIKRIEKYTALGKEAFCNDELIQARVIHHLTIIGESVNKLSEDFREQYPQITYEKITGLRNILVRCYFGLNPERVWTIVETDLPELKRAITGIKN